MRLGTVIAALAAVAIVTGCAGAIDGSASLGSASATPAPPSPRASVAESETPPQPSSSQSAQPAASPVAVQVSQCEHSTGQYQVHLPSGWWTNREFEDHELGDIAACRFFAPTEFDVTTGDHEAPMPDGASIWMEFLDGGCVGYINPVLESRQTTVDGHPAAASELAEGKLEPNPAGTYQYVVNLKVDLACEDGGQYIYAFTKPDFPGDYEENKAALDQMMQSLDVRGP